LPARIGGGKSDTIPSLSETMNISAAPSLSMSATTGYSIAVLLERGTLN
jgi:hypothetical protein